MSELILHHYWESPYAEKIRRILGFKGLAWRSVIIPMMMPKPDLTALTGGYRKTPVLQIGADVYCDTDLIARVLERRHPEPSLFPAGTEGPSHMLGPWQGELFWLCVRAVGTSAPVLPPGFVEDRAQMIEGGLDVATLLANAPAERGQLRAKLDLLERHLAAHGPFVLGARPSLADFSLFHPLFLLRTVPQTAPALEPFGAIGGWLARLEAVGHGRPSEMTAADALEVARRATPAPAPPHDAGDAQDLSPGSRVEVVHESFGRDPVVGELVASSADAIALRRQDPRAGDVVVHLPREHYLVRPV
jgi:glutathione S-transferase